MEVEEKIHTGEIKTGPGIKTTMHFEVSKLKHMLGVKDEGPKPPPLNIVPTIEPLMNSLELGDWIEGNQARGGRYGSMEVVIDDPRGVVRDLQPYAKLYERRPSLSTLNVQEAFMVYFQVSVVTGFVLASPWIFFQIWSFIAAGLYPHEKRYVNVFLPVSIGLFLLGVFVCQFLVMPKAVEALLWFNDWLELEPDLRLNEWLGFAIMMPVVFGLSFQTPLVMLFLERIGILTVEHFRGTRRIAWFVLAIFSAIITPSVDALSMLFLWVPMCLLYELGIMLCLWAPKRPTFEFEESESEELIEV